MSLNLGVLSIQGDVLENIISIKAAIDALDIDGTVTSVRTPDEIIFSRTSPCIDKTPRLRLMLNLHDLAYVILMF
jgi:hypothetical protein